MTDATGDHPEPGLMPPLTIERLFSEPDLNGAVPRALQFSPDGKRATWLQGSAADTERLDLWQYDIDGSSAAHGGRRNAGAPGP